MLLFVFWFPLPFKLFQQLRQPRHDGAYTKPLAVVIRRGATDDLAIFDITPDPRLRSHNDAIADMAVPGHSDLSGENCIIANVRGAGQAYLRTEQRVFANRGAVSYLNEVVDLSAAADARFADTGAVNARIGLNFDIIFDDCRA